MRRRRLIALPIILGLGLVAPGPLWHDHLALPKPPFVRGDHAQHARDGTVLSGATQGRTAPASQCPVCYACRILGHAHAAPTATLAGPCAKTAVDVPDDPPVTLGFSASPDARAPPLV